MPTIDAQGNLHGSDGQFANKPQSAAGYDLASMADGQDGYEWDYDGDAAYFIDDAGHLEAPGALLHGTKMLEVEAVVHVGSLDPALRSEGSYEGDTLSVSVHPDAWEQISDTTAGTRWHLRRTDGKPLRFVWWQRVNPQARDAVRAWGQERGWVTQKPTWRVTQIDCETDEPYWFEVGSHEEALREADLEPDDDPDEYEVQIEERPGSWRITSTFPDSRVPADVDPTDILTALYIRENLPDVDGVWWGDAYDPERMSAPRGGVVHPTSHYSTAT